MPSREPVTLETLDKIHEVIKRNISEFQKYKCEATLSFLIVRLYEYFISYFTFYDSSDNKIANYKSIVKILPYQHDVKALVVLRDRIVHNPEMLIDYRDSFLTYLDAFTKENFNYLVEHSLGKEYLGLYDTIIEYCKSEEPTDMALF